MVVPRLTEDIQASLDAWQKNVVAAENVQDAADVKPVFQINQINWRKKTALVLSWIGYHLHYFLGPVTLQ